MSSIIHTLRIRVNRKTSRLKAKNVCDNLYKEAVKWENLNYFPTQLWGQGDMTDLPTGLFTQSSFIKDLFLFLIKPHENSGTSITNTVLIHLLEVQVSLIVSVEPHSLMV